MAIRTRSRTRSACRTAVSVSRPAATARDATSRYTARTPMSSSFSSAMRILRFAVMPLFVATLVPAASAQEPAPPAAEPPQTGFDVHGSVDAGYRFRDLDGSEAAYRQIFDLEEGLRLFGADVYGTA